MSPLLRSLTIALALLTAGFVHAGSGTAKLTCTSASGRTTFTANLQDIVGIFEGGLLTIDGVALAFPEAGDGDTGDVVWDPANGVFTITFSHSTPDGPVWFRFWAVPNTFQVVSSDRGSPEGAIYTFDGIIEAKEPRPDKDLITPRIRLSCRLEYRI
ncbi:MAG: hypothetical protein JNL05_06390 [Flavobacteriales bacterium]|nr:hypothetical protein [Flavobacteriales bacterium]